MRSGSGWTAAVLILFLWESGALAPPAVGELT
jgi:hypothetical protein